MKTWFCPYSRKKLNKTEQKKKLLQRFWYHYFTTVICNNFPFFIWFILIQDGNIRFDFKSQIRYIILPECCGQSVCSLSDRSWNTFKSQSSRKYQAEMVGSLFIWSEICACTFHGDSGCYIKTALKSVLATMRNMHELDVEFGGLFNTSTSTTLQEYRVWSTLNRAKEPEFFRFLRGRHFTINTGLCKSNRFFWKTINYLCSDSAAKFSTQVDWMCPNVACKTWRVRTGYEMGHDRVWCDNVQKGGTQIPATGRHTFSMSSHPTGGV